MGTRDKLTPDHVIASGAMPPDFPSIRIGEELYWDGACVANTPLDAILEDDVKVLDYLKANASAPIEIVPGVAVPEELIFKYGYGYARYALRPADCQLRLAMSVALHELWGAGVVSNILKKYGLSNRNLTYFPLD